MARPLELGRGTLPFKLRVDPARRPQLSLDIANAPAICRPSRARAWTTPGSGQRSPTA